jgi:hypothetical protein
VRTLHKTPRARVVWQHRGLVSRGLVSRGLVSSIDVWCVHCTRPREPELFGSTEV